LKRILFGEITAVTSKLYLLIDWVGLLVMYWIFSCLFISFLPIWKKEIKTTGEQEINEIE
jgi:hypothetical protein